jgi:hypothetical protein
MEANQKAEPVLGFFCAKARRRKSEKPKRGKGEKDWNEERN